MADAHHLESLEEYAHKMRTQPDNAWLIRRIGDQMTAEVEQALKGKCRGGYQPSSAPGGSGRPLAIFPSPAGQQPVGRERALFCDPFPDAGPAIKRRGARVELQRSCPVEPDDGRVADAQSPGSGNGPGIGRRHPESPVLLGGFGRKRRVGRLGHRQLSGCRLD